MKNNKVKKILLGLLISGICLNLVACSKNTPKEDETIPQNESTNETQNTSKDQTESNNHANSIDVTSNQTAEDFTKNKLAALEDVFSEINYKKLDNQRTFLSDLEEKTILGQAYKDLIYAYVDVNEDTDQAMAVAEAYYYIHKEDKLDPNDKTLKTLYNLCKIMPSTNIGDISYEDFIDTLNSAEQYENIFGGESEIKRYSDYINIDIVENSTFMLPGFTPKDFTYEDAKATVSSIYERIAEVEENLVAKYGYDSVEEAMQITKPEISEDYLNFELYYSAMPEGSVDDDQIFYDLINAVAPIMSEALDYTINTEAIISNIKTSKALYEATDNRINPFFYEKSVGTDTFGRSLQIYSAYGGFHLRLPITIEGKSSR